MKTKPHCMPASEVHTESIPRPRALHREHMTAAQTFRFACPSEHPTLAGVDVLAQQSLAHSAPWYTPQACDAAASAEVQCRAAVQSCCWLSLQAQRSMQHQQQLDMQLPDTSRWRVPLGGALAHAYQSNAVVDNHEQHIVPAAPYTTCHTSAAQPVASLGHRACTTQGCRM